MPRSTLVKTNWLEASYKERWLSTILNMILICASHDEAMTVLLSLLANTVNEDEIDTVVDQFNSIKKH